MSSTVRQKRDASEMMSSSPAAVATASSADEPSSSSSSISSRPRGTLATLLSRPSAFANESGSLPIGEFEPTAARTFTENDAMEVEVEVEGAVKLVRDAAVLVIGAGGLGCEILKDLAMSCLVKRVVVIDLDTIDVTNLNRQFLFRQSDVGKSKAEVAASFIQNRCPWLQVEFYHGKIQDKDAQFYKQFNVVISGLDNIEARRWLNGMMHSLVQFDDDGDPRPETIIPLIDGGTEGFSGQARLILPRITSCFECSLDAFAPSAAVPLCTIAETPRIPEHCIAYAFILQWPKEFPDRKLNPDSPDDMKWVYQQALERANKYNIHGVTYMLTLGVVKNIIPAVASTNAIISAMCVNEAIKLLSFASQSLNTYVMYMGSEGIHSHTFVYDKKDTCPVCTSHVHTLHISPSTTLNSLLHMLCDKDGRFKLKTPSITSSSKTLYMRKPLALEKATRKNLDKTLGELLEGRSGEELVVTDPVVFPETSLGLVLTFAE
ncbi:hypothetical protein ACHAXS_010004 [Conticribra weissflogii]